MISFLICLALLIGGYFVYGKVVENTFGPDDRETPAVKINDGNAGCSVGTYRVPVDYLRYDFRRRCA